MKMACSGGHFPIFICEDTKEDHKKCIAFLWNPNGLLIRTRNNSYWDDNGQRPPSELKPNVLPKTPKENQVEMKMGDKFLWQVKASTKMSLIGSFKQVIEILLWGHDLIIDHGHVF